MLQMKSTISKGGPCLAAFSRQVWLEVAQVMPGLEGPAPIQQLKEDDCRMTTAARLWKELAGKRCLAGQS